MYISLASSFDHCTQGGTGDSGDSHSIAGDGASLLSPLLLRLLLLGLYMSLMMLLL